MKFGIRQQLFFCKSVKGDLIEVKALRPFCLSDLFVKIYLNKTRFTLFLSLIFLSSKIIEPSFFCNILYIIFSSVTDDMSYFLTIIFFSFSFSSKESSISVSIGVFISFSGSFISLLLSSFGDSFFSL